MPRRGASQRSVRLSTTACIGSTTPTSAPRSTRAGDPRSVTATAIRARDAGHRPLTDPIAEALAGEYIRQHSTDTTDTIGGSPSFSATPSPDAYAREEPRWYDHRDHVSRRRQR